MGTTQYSDSYIAFIDILGFKKLIENNDCSSIYKIFAKKFNNPVSNISIDGKSIIDMQAIDMRVMSDSICFFVQADIPNALVGLVKVCQHFQNELLQMDPPILTRGAIVRGNLFAEGNIIFGPAFVKAYLMEENNAKHPRIILTKEVLDSALDNTSNNARNIVYFSTFRDYDAYYTIDYFELAEGLDTDNTRTPALTDYINHILDSVTDGSVREKYLYVKKHLER